MLAIGYIGAKLVKKEAIYWRRCGFRILSGRPNSKGRAIPFLYYLLFSMLLGVEYLTLKRVQSYIMLGERGIKVAVLLRLLFDTFL